MYIYIALGLCMCVYHSRFQVCAWHAFSPRLLREHLLVVLERA